MQFQKAGYVMRLIAQLHEDSEATEQDVSVALTSRILPRRKTQQTDDATAVYTVQLFYLIHPPYHVPYDRLLIYYRVHLLRTERGPNL